MARAGDDVYLDSDETRAAWDAIARGYDEHVTPTHEWLGEQVLDRAGLAAGARLLDVAAGSGALSLPALRHGAHVLAVDLSPRMIEALVRRVTREGHQDFEGRVMDGHALDLDDEQFDVAASQFGVMLFPDLPRGLREMRRVTRPQGRVAIAAYGAPDEVEFLQVFVGAMRTVIPDFAGLPMDPPPLPFQVADPRVLRARMQEAGLRSVRVETVTETLEFESGERLWAWLMNSNPIPRMLVANLSAAQRAALVQSLEELLRERAGSAAAARLTNPVHIAVGVR